MKVYLVTYDLKNPGRDYVALYEAIKRSGKWWHYLDSTWLVATNESATQVYNRLSQYIDKNDFIFVIRVTNEYSGWLPQDAWDWIRHEISSLPFSDPP